MGTCIIEPGRAKDAINGRSRVKRVQEPEQLAPCARPNRIAGSSGSHVMVKLSGIAAVMTPGLLAF